MSVSNKEDSKLKQDILASGHGNSIKTNESKTGPVINLFLCNVFK